MGKRFFMLFVTGWLLNAAACRQADEEGEIGTDSSGGTDSEIGYRSLIFSLANETASTVYVPYSLRVDVERAVDDGWEAVDIWGAPCMEDCADVEKDETCCVICDIAEPFVTLIPSGEETSVSWDGRLRRVREDLCNDCGCNEAYAPEDGRYRVTACWYSDYACTEDGCTGPTEVEAIFNAVPNGEEACATGEFDIPSLEKEITLRIAESSKPD